MVDVEQALALTTRPSIATGRSAKALRPVAAAGLVTAALASTLVLPLAMIAPLGVIALLGFMAVEVGSVRAARALSEYTAWRAKERRREERIGALLKAGCSTQPLVELECTVAAIEQRDEDLAKRLDLDALLDRHVALMLAYQRALGALNLADRRQLEHIRDAQRADPEHEPRRLELCERRLRCLDQTEARAQKLADELAIVADTVGLVAQRVAMPDEVANDELVDRCFVELDARDAAQRQLAAELHARQ